MANCTGSIAPAASATSWENGAFPPTTSGGSMLSFGVTILPDPPYTRLIELTTLAEQQGFEYGWTYDSHVLWQESTPLIALLPEEPPRIKLGQRFETPATRDQPRLQSP